MVELLKSSHFEWAKNWKQVSSIGYSVDGVALLIARKSLFQP